MTLYLDTSSLVKLYVSEPDSDSLRTLVSQAAIVATSSVAYPEARAALARRRRERALSPAALAAAKRALDHDWSTYLVIEATSTLCREAGALAARYRLRGFDSVHLASYAAVARRAGVRDTRFSSADDDLNRAARGHRRTLAAEGDA